MPDRHQDYLAIVKTDPAGGAYEIGVPSVQTLLACRSLPDGRDDFNPRGRQIWSNPMLISRRSILRQSAILLGGAGLCLLSDEKAHALTVAHGQQIYAYAHSKLGVPYALPPNWPLSTDCSRLTQAAYGAVGISIPRTAAAQWSACRYSANVLGALVFFATDPMHPGVVTHVGVNRGDGVMIDANSNMGKVVEESWAGSSYWIHHFIGCATL